MILQKQNSKKKGMKKYYKWTLVIPSDIIEEANLKKGDELVARVLDNKIIIKKVREQ